MNDRPARWSFRISALVAGVAVLLSSALASWAAPQKDKIDLIELTKQSQHIYQAEGKIVFVWWVSNDYWRVALAQSGQLAPEQIENTMETVRPYIVITVAEATVDDRARTAFKPEEDVRAEVILKDKAGVKYKPLEEDDISDDMKTLINAMRPAMTGMIGPLGRNMFFLCFSAQNAKGQDIIQPDKKGSFSVVVGDKEYKFKLPLDATVPKIICPKCKEVCSGTWSFCPWCGAKLPEPAEPDKE